MSVRVTAAVEAHRKQLETIREYNPDQGGIAPVLAMADAIAVSDAMIFSPANIERAAAALWDSAPPVRYGVRPRWADMKDDPQWAHSAAVTRADAKTVADTLAAAP